MIHSNVIQIDQNGKYYSNRLYSKERRPQYNSDNIMPVRKSAIPKKLGMLLIEKQWVPRRSIEKYNVLLQLNERAPTSIKSHTW